MPYIPRHNIGRSLIAYMVILTGVLCNAVWSSPVQLDNIPASRNDRSLAVAGVGDFTNVSTTNLYLDVGPLYYIYTATLNAVGGSSETYFITDPGGTDLSNITTAAAFGAQYFANIFNGNVTVQNGSSIDCTNYNDGHSLNVITAGGLTLNGSGEAYFKNGGSGDTKNTIAGDISVSGTGKAYFCNSGDGILTNTFSGNITVTDQGFVNLTNLGSGTTANDIASVTLDATPIWSNPLYIRGAINLGTTGCTTNIGTLDWRSGALTFFYKNGSDFGTTQITNLDLSNATTPILYLFNFNGEPLSSAPTQLTILTANTITGDPTKIQLVHNSALTEVFATPGAPNGISISGTNVSINGGTISVNLVPAATAGDSGELAALDSTTSDLSSVQASVSNSAQQFAPSTTLDAWHKAREYRQLVNSFRENRRSIAFEGMINNLKKNGRSIIKFKGNSTVWLIPYATYLKNTGAGGYRDGFEEKYYGLLLGLSRFSKYYNTNITGMLGIGATKTQMDRSPNSYTDGKSFMAGLSVRKTLKRNIDIETNIAGMMSLKKQQRQGNPTPSTKYVAISEYKSYAISWRTEAGPVIKFKHGISIKPDIGLQINTVKRSKIQEKNAGIYNQRYKEKLTTSWEQYGGLGLRKEWKTRKWNSKITVKYEVGYKSGNGKTSSTIYTDTTQNGVTVTANTPGRLTHYVMLYGSVLSMKGNWKLVPGVQAAFQKGQNTYTGSLKFEYRW